jgi:hypothetical protein
MLHPCGSTCSGCRPGGPRGRPYLSGGGTSSASYLGPGGRPSAYRPTGRGRASSWSTCRSKLSTGYHLRGWARYSRSGRRAPGSAPACRARRSDRLAVRGPNCLFARAPGASRGASRACHPPQRRAPPLPPSGRRHRRRVHSRRDRCAAPSRLSRARRCQSERP